MNKLFLFFLVIIFLLRQIMYVSADNDTYINTSNIIYDEEKNVIEFAENSKINIKDTNILVDRGIIDYNKDIIEVFGNFYLYQDLNILSGKDLIGNIDFNKFTANDVSYIYNNDLKIDSDQIERSDGVIYFYNNFLTPCEIEGYFNCPTWSLRVDKTRYNINKDKFNHYDAFLQIADYKVFYLPYFSHYGIKAPRQKGFLTPTLEFTIGGDNALITPYYLPIGIQNDVIFKPKIILDTNFEYTENFSINTIFNNKNSGGVVNLDIYTQKLKNDSDIYSSARLKGDQTINKNNILSYEALVTNSVSTTRSINDESTTFEDIFVRLDSYNTFYKSDYLKTEISTVEALDTTKSGFVPLIPSIKYTNQQLLNNNLTLKNQLNFINLKRNESSIDKPSDTLFLTLNNSLSSNNLYKNFRIYNELELVNNFGNYKFKHNSLLDDDVYGSYGIISSDTFINLNENIKPRLKFVKNMNFISDKIINENGKALTFNYHNQFSDSRLFGNNLEDNSTRIIYGLENNFKILHKRLDLNINQSYDFKSNTNYTNTINQNSKFSDIAIEAKTSFDNLFFKIDTRLDKNQFEKKEMNYSLNYENNIDIKLDYHETNSNSFKNLSSDTQSLGVNLGKKINENFHISMNSNLDLKNNYSPFSQSVKLSIFDECSKLDITYTDERFNDDYNTKPNETISISYYMDYLGFFGYEQKSNLFFEEPGDFNYGL